LTASLHSLSNTSIFQRFAIHPVFVRGLIERVL